MRLSSSKLRRSDQIAVVLIRDPRYRVGGFETWVETLAAGLRQRGVPVHLLIPSPPGSEAHTEREGGGRIAIPAVEGVEAQAAEVLRVLQRLAAEGHAGIYFNLGYRYISVAGFHLDGSPWLPVPVAHGRHPAGLDWILCGPPRRIVAPSPDYAETLREELARRIGRFRARGRVWAIPHGVALPPEDSVTAKWQHASELLNIAVVSRLDEFAKRPWDYVRIAERLSAAAIPFRMRILGDGPCEPALRAWVADRRMQEVVSLEGAVSGSEVSECLAASHVMISASESEAFGLAVAEAMAHACAVIGADIPGTVRDLLGEGRGVRVPIGDITAFVDAVIRLASNWRAASCMGLAGREYVARQYSVDRMISRYCDLLWSLRRRIRPSPEWQAPPVRYASPGEALAARAAGHSRLRRILRHGLFLRGAMNRGAHSLKPRRDISV